MRIAHSGLKLAPGPSSPEGRGRGKRRRTVAYYMLENVDQDPAKRGYACECTGDSGEGKREECDSGGGRRGMMKYAKREMQMPARERATERERKEERHARCISAQNAAMHREAASRYSAGYTRCLPADGYPRFR